jgi:hypothetical protein
MGFVFLSHSSKDKEFVRDLARDLARLGMKPWLDEWEIRIGECIVSKVDSAIANADYVILVLSPNSVESGWVEREWKARYWDEINEKKVIVLPVLLRDCQIPALIKTKRYADFRESYAVGLANLANALIPARVSEIMEDTARQVPGPTEVRLLIERLQTPGHSISRAIAESLSLSHRFGSGELEKFCRGELSGWDRGEQSESLPHRQIDVFLAPNSEINAFYIEWSEDLSKALEFMRREPKQFIPYRLQVGLAISDLERDVDANSKKMLLTFSLPRQSLFPETKQPDRPLLAYARGDSYERIIGAVRVRLTELLLDLLPKINTP